MNTNTRPALACSDPCLITKTSPRHGLWLTLLASSMLVLGSVVSQAQVFRIDFGAATFTTERAAAPDDPIYYWNNVTEGVGTSATGVLTNIVTDANGSSTLGLAMIIRFNGANTAGTTATAAPYPADATRDSLYGNTEVFNSLTNIFPSFKLTGLNPAATYNLTFYASRAGVTDNRETGYTVTGANTGFAALNASGNVTNQTNVLGILPDASRRRPTTITRTTSPTLAC